VSTAIPPRLYYSRVNAADICRLSPDRWEPTSTPDVGASVPGLLARELRQPCRQIGILCVRNEACHELVGFASAIDARDDLVAHSIGALQPTS
jgi:hypothetical protein